MKLVCVSWCPNQECVRFDIPSLALLVVLELVLDHADDNVVGDESALVHDLLGLATELSLLCDLGAEHVSGSLRRSISRYPWSHSRCHSLTYQVAAGEHLLDLWCLGALAFLTR